MDNALNLIYFFTTQEEIMKKLLSVILAFLFVASSAISCSQSENETETQPENVLENNETDNVTETEDIGPDLPEKSYNGEDFTFFVRSENYMPQWYAIDIDTDGSDGTPINDAVYYRNLQIENKYDVVINQYYSDSPQDEFTKLSNAGETQFDALVLSVERDLQGLLRNSLLQNAAELPYIDYGDEWWDNSSIESMKLGNAAYVLESDLTIVDKYATAGILFNKNMIENYQLDNLYDLVRDGKWTFDSMLEMSEKVAGDTNGDGVMGSEDTVAQIGEQMNVYLFMAGFGLNTAVVRDETIEMQVGDERYINLLVPVVEYMMNKNISYTDGLVDLGTSDSWEAEYHPLFVDDRALFYPTEMNRFTLLREFDVDFGVVPFPKSDETQNRYYSPVDTAAASGIAVPKTQNDLEMTGIILDALSYESMKQLQPAFYEVNLTKKEVRDEDSVEMLEMMFANRTIDIGIVYDFGGVGNMLRRLVRKSNTDVVSAFAEIKEMCNTDIEELLTSIK